MNTQPEPLLLADALDDEFTQGRISNYNGRKAAIALRHLYEVNQELLEALKDAASVIAYDHGLEVEETEQWAVITKATGEQP